jgi:Rieske Fe-S protein
MKRKQFLHQCGAACTGGILLAAWVQSCSTQKSLPVLYKNSQLIVPIASFYTEHNGAKKWKRSVIIRHEKTAFPIVVFRHKETDYKAILLRCTHQGNELNVYGDIITCSAHGSEFGLSGEVLQGPAESKLQAFKVTADDLNIYIHIS